MRLIVECGQLQEAMAAVHGCLPSKSTIPILQNVLITPVGADRAKLLAYHYEREAEIIFPCEIEDGSPITVGGKILAQVVKNFAPSTKIEITPDEETEQATVKCGTAKFMVRTLPAKDFPQMKKKISDGDVVSTFKVGSLALLDLLRMVIYSCDKSAVEHAWSRGMLICPSEGRLLALGSDDKRMARHSIPLPAGAEAMPHIVLPYDSAKEIIRNLVNLEGTVELRVTKNIFELVCGPLRIASRLIGAEFPPGYIKQIDTAYEPAFNVYPAALAEAVERVMAVKATSDDKYFPMTFEVTGKRLAISCGDVHKDRAEEEVAADILRDNFKFKVQSRFLIDVLAAWPESVEMEVQFKQAMPVVFSSSKRPELRHFMATLLR